MVVVVLVVLAVLAVLAVVVVGFILRQSWRVARREEEEEKMKVEGGRS